MRLSPTLLVVLVLTFAPRSSIAAVSASTARADDVASWPVYRSGPYHFELRHPPDYVIVTPAERPQPPPLFRVWFQEANLASSPLGGRHPPQFAVDVYGNASQQPLAAWLETSGVIGSPGLFDHEAAQVGGVKAIRLTGRALVAPNRFYYVARGGFVYRFTLLGPFSDRILATVTFLP